MISVRDTKSGVDACASDALFQRTDVWREDGALPAAEFELFDNVANLLKPVCVPLLFALIVRDHLH